MFATIFLISVLSLGSAQQFAPVKRNADDICTRNDGKPGYCVKLQNCSTILSMFDRRRQGTPFQLDEISYIRNSSCNPHKMGYVCCENEDKVLQGVQELSTIECGKFCVAKVNGRRKVPVMSRPWMALLKFKTESGTEHITCGGTIINKRYILTAAHCFDKQKLMSVRLVKYNITSDTDYFDTKGRGECAPTVQDFHVERVFIHEQYSSGPDFYNDIALVKLKSDVEFISPICLPVNETLQQEVETFKYFLLGAWSSESDVLQEAIVSNKDCKNFQTAIGRELKTTQICASCFRQDSCRGDSGGPLIHVDMFRGNQRLVQFGIVSFGIFNSGVGYPDVYTNVGSFIPWIAYKIATK